jgi:hypothetical protein
LLLGNRTRVEDAMTWRGGHGRNAGRDSLLMERRWHASVRGLTTSSNEKTSMNRITRRTRSITAAIAMLLMTAGCSETVAGPHPSWGRLVADDVLSIQEAWSGFTQPTLTLITNVQDWAIAWGTLYTNVSPQPALPQIDFGSSVLVLAAMGARPSGGYSIEIEEVRAQSGTLHVRVLQRSPGPSCVTTAAITAPVHIVQVPREGTHATFSVRSETYGC